MLDNYGYIPVVHMLSRKIVQIKRDGYYSNRAEFRFVTLREWELIKRFFPHLRINRTPS